MRDLRWVEGDVGCTDLVDETGAILGYIGPISTGWRAQVIEHLGGPPVAATADHPTEVAARAWVEGEVKAGGADGLR